MLKHTINEKPPCRKEWYNVSVEFPAEAPGVTGKNLRWFLISLMKAFELNNNPDEFNAFLDTLPPFVEKINGVKKVITLDQMFDLITAAMPKLQKRNTLHQEGA